jgi:hypothetical protein
MLQLTKNNIVTDVVKNELEVRQLELDWFCNNYSTITDKAAMLTGFAFFQLTTDIPDKEEGGNTVPSLGLEFMYLFLTCIAIGLNLSAIILSTFLSVWAPSLALRGKMGARDLHKAVDCLRDYQTLVLHYFIIGWIVYFISSILQVWIYYKRQVALVVTIPFSFFVIAILWYYFSITNKLRLNDDEVVSGKIDHLQPYEFIGDVDHELHNGLKDKADTQHKGAGAQPDHGYCPIHEPIGAEWRPRLGYSSSSSTVAQGRPMLGTQASPQGGWYTSLMARPPVPHPPPGQPLE